MTDIFDKIGSAETFQNSAYVEPGICPVVWVEAFEIVERRKGPMCIINLHVIDGDPEGNKSKSECAHFIMLNTDSGPSNARRALAQILGVNVDIVDSSAVKKASSADNPLRGSLVSLKAHNTKTKAGKDFTVVNYTRLSDEYQAKAKELHKAAGF